MELYRYYPGIYPVVVNVPHAGTRVPPVIAERFTDEALLLPDTDWYVDKLYNFARDMHVHLLVAINSRYIVDLNRNRVEETLYPGQYGTGVIPTRTFCKHPIYKKGEELDEMEANDRLGTYWQPYHNKLIKVLQHCLYQHGKVVVLDAHSIKSQVESLFDGILPDLNIGTNSGHSADPILAQRVLKISEESGYSTVINGRFKGGYITRHYGKPDAGCHTIQLEMAQKLYMSEDRSCEFSHEKAADVRHRVLEPLLTSLIEWVQK